jgi:hypothetical protein
VKNAAHFPPGENLVSEYERLLLLTRREAELVATGDLEEIGGLHEERNRIRATLPETPPADAKPLLEEALRLMRSTEGVLAAALAATGDELRRLGEGRRAVQAYGRSSISAES